MSGGHGRRRKKHEEHEEHENHERWLVSAFDMMTLLFVLFVATWIALFLARQISVPISALLEGARELRKGNLKHRVNVGAIDELAILVRAF